MNDDQAIDYDQVFATLDVICGTVCHRFVYRRYVEMRKRGVVGAARYIDAVNVAGLVLRPLVFRRVTPVVSAGLASW